MFLLLLYSLIQNIDGLTLMLPSFLVNYGRTRRQQSWLKQPISCSTRLSRTTCGTTSLAGLRSAAGLYVQLHVSIRMQLGPHFSVWTWPESERVVTEPDPNCIGDLFFRPEPDPSLEQLMQVASLSYPVTHLFRNSTSWGLNIREEIWDLKSLSCFWSHFAIVMHCPAWGSVFRKSWRDATEVNC